MTLRRRIEDLEDQLWKLGMLYDEACSDNDYGAAGDIEHDVEETRRELDGLRLEVTT